MKETQARGRRQEEGAQEEATVGLLWPSADLFLGRVKSESKNSLFVREEHPSIQRVPLVGSEIPQITTTGMYRP